MTSQSMLELCERSRKTLSGFKHKVFDRPSYASYVNRLSGDPTGAPDAVEGALEHLRSVEQRWSYALRMSRKSKLGKSAD